MSAINTTNCNLLGNTTLLFGLILLGTGCGFFDARIVDYAPETTEPAPCDQGLTIFQSKIQPALRHCAQCHVQQTIAGSPLSRDPSANRTTLLKFQTNRDLFAKISNPSSHGGGDKSEVLPKASIDAWLDAEKACQ